LFVTGNKNIHTLEIMLEIIYRHFRELVSSFFENAYTFIQVTKRNWKNAYFYAKVSSFVSSSKLKAYVLNYGALDDSKKYQIVAGRYHLLGEIPMAKLYGEAAESLKTSLRETNAPFYGEFKWAGGDWVSNIGHTAMGLDILHAKKTLEGVEVPIFFYSKGNGNLELLKIFAQHLSIFKLSKKDYFDFQRIFRNYEFEMDYIPIKNTTVDFHEAYKYYNETLFPKKTSLSLFPEQREAAQKSLEQAGINLSKPFIAFHVREQKEYDELRAGNQGDLISVVRALSQFSTLGFQFIRMGQRGVTPLDNLLRRESKIVQESFFDYANSAEKSEVVDLYLWANCDFFVGGDSGPIMVPPLFSKPTLRVNSAMPFMHNVGFTGYVLPKFVSESGLGKFLSFNVLKDSTGFMHTSVSKDKYSRHFVSTQDIVGGISDMISLSRELSNNHSTDAQFSRFDLPVCPSFVKKHNNLFGSN
jgi:putative glycosyltransferase (TIGR04372 family)